MTTEVLRNMIYAGSPALDGLRYVVLDEVHYLQDAYRGPVWEEVIIHLPPTSTSCACRPRCRTPRSSPTGSARCAGPTDGGHRGAPPGRARTPLPASATAASERPPPAADARRRPPQPGGRAGSTRSARRAAAPVARRPGAGALHARGASRSSSCSHDEAMLPAIYFIFSRAGCDDAVAAVPRRRAAAHRPPTSGRASARSPRRTAASADRRRPRRARLRPVAGRPRGRARRPPRRAWCPPFKEAVEACFAAGPGQGRVRHRDARARHQHAGPRRS